MLKFLLVSLLIIQTAFAAKLSLGERRSKIIGIVNEELAEVSRLAKQQKYRSPDTLLRMAELNLEKARLYREAENERYLSIPPEERRKLKKDSYFKTSTKYFNAANDAGHVVAKKFPTYKGVGDVYYILAYNYKELGNEKQAQKYFNLSAKKSSKNSQIGMKSRLALADYYYHDNKFQQAIPLYESTINKLDEKWWTKDTFNLAWSYYRVKNYSRAIDLMREVHRKSGSNKYVDMKSVVERDIGIFYVDAGRIDDATKFYSSLGINYTDQFIKIANSIVVQGKFAQAEKLLNEAEKHEKSPERRAEILIAQLNLFDKFNKVNSHLKVCEELVSINQKTPLNSDQLTKLNYHVNKKAAELQKLTASDTYKNVPKVRRQKANAAIKYFALAYTLSPGQKAEKMFFQGETAYAANSFGRSLPYYVGAFDIAKASGDKKVMVQSLDGMLSALGQPKLSKKTANKYYIPVYSRYLSVDNSSAKANTIYVKLFNSQYDSGDVEGSEKTLTSFAKSFPSDFKTQEAMLAKIMEHYRKKKDYGTVKTYVGRINDGEFKVSKKYADALRGLMTKIQIEGVQQSLQRGDKAIALKGYHQIYESNESTPKAKTNAAYNLAALYYELDESTKSYQWSVTAMNDMDSKDVSRFSDSFLSMASGLFLKQHFSESADLSYRLLGKLCRENSSNKTVAYKNSVYISLANDELDKAIEIKNLGKRCGIPDAVISEVTFEILEDLGEKKRWEAYEKTIAELDNNSRNYARLIKPLEDLRLEYVRMGNVADANAVANKQNKFYQTAKAQKLDIPVEALDLIADRMLVGVVEKKQKLESIRLRFPENEFNGGVKLKLQLLDQLTSDVNAIQKVGSGKGIVEAYKYAIEAYESFGTELKNFTPEGKSPEYISSFKKAMGTVYGPILANAQKQRNEIKKLIHENKILTYSNFAVLYPENETYKRFLTEKDGILMERGGQR